jgi:hypothetical protein
MDSEFVSNELAQFLFSLEEESLQLMPGVKDDALREYKHLPEWELVTEAGADDRPLEDSLSFGLYFAFAHTSPDFPDYPGEILSAMTRMPYSLDRLVDRAIHQSLSGRFMVVSAQGNGRERRLIRARDLLSRNTLTVSFAPAEGSPNDDLLNKPGTVFRAHLVPWGDLWFVRGPLTYLPDGVEPSAQGDDLRLWFANVVKAEEEAWAALVLDGDTGMIPGIEASPYAAPGALVRALQMAHRVTRHLPDLLITPDGFPFVDRSGRTISSWRERRVMTMAQVIAMSKTKVGRDHEEPHPTPQAVSLLKPWVEVFGVRHVTDAKAVTEITGDFSSVVKSGFPKTKKTL